MWKCPKRRKQRFFEKQEPTLKTGLIAMQTPISVKENQFIRVLLFAFFIFPHLLLYSYSSFTNKSANTPIHVYFLFGLLLWAYLDVIITSRDDGFTINVLFIKARFHKKSINKLLLNDTLWMGTKPA
jgi:hypothetical protein